MTMDNTTKLEDKRAYRIALRVEEKHSLLASIYEKLVDREYDIAEKEIKIVILDLRLIIKSMKDDDF
jgi:hypothetical protein